MTLEHLKKIQNNIDFLYELRTYCVEEVMKNGCSLTKLLMVNKIAGIMWYRRQNPGLSLAECKQYCESLIDNYTTSP